jgi:hypothetical protein
MQLTASVPGKKANDEHRFALSEFSTELLSIRGSATSS